MKKFLIGFMVFVLILFIFPAVTFADSNITIDGVIGSGEWDGATQIPVASGMGDVFVIAETDYLYVLFDLNDSTDARTSYPFEVGNDQISININPTDGGPWGFPYDLIFETSALSSVNGGHHVLPWNPKVNSGTLDGWATRWFPNNAQDVLPADLESSTLYSGGKRITEWKIPLSSVGVSPGDELKIGGAVDVGDGNSYVYPIGLDWGNASTFQSINIPAVPTKAEILINSGVLGKGLDSAPGLDKPFNPKSQAGENAGQK